ncbi:ryncolin-1-like [Liolophura sinensis]|uniref:ryncolin-1-like n=1 Tax=Liolophura sinensis TaxID=3198878 RepID=UPI00315896C8
MDKQMSILKRQLQTERLRRNKLESQLRGQTRAIHRYRQVCRKNETYPPAIRDCQDVYEYISRKHGVFEIQPKNGPKMSVFCEDGWTVFQSREDGSVTFDRDWEEYKHGFGKPSAEYWLGNENIHYVSRQKSYKLMVELGDWEGRSANAIYDSFKIENEQGFYRLHLGKFVTGAARDGLRFHESIGHGGSVNGMAFSTRDRDHDKSSRNCAKLYNGGWWYNDCFWSNLNGDYVYKGGVFSDKFTWFPWKMNHYSLKTSKMKLKPT